ncbi:DNA-binding protein HB1 [Galliscardovia ingluviei]|uniref:DNA-binding protein HB1 n=1 Tax=Galliscardovia ingluviei TaxID=1769422 RepID=A0A8J3ALT7_9BIFI|nr:HU family DNA-binding protein [Galliscardovia ingluviei]GGI12708.1 DNA-binding protein HB1 [Galliscardovia ingluviei]
MAYNKSELVSKIAQKSNLTKSQAEAAVDAFKDVLIESLKEGEGIKLTGVLSATRVKRSARTGRNPRTGETIDIPSRYGVKLTAGTELKRAVSEE